MLHGTEIGGAGRPAARTFRAVVQAMSDGFRRRAAAARMRRNLTRELADLNADQLDRLLGDFGVSRAELDMFIARAPYSRELLDGMLARLKISRDDLQRDRAVQRDIEHHCAVCDSQRRCRLWLAGNGDGLGYHRFCPNAEAFDSLLDRARSRVAR